MLRGRLFALAAETSFATLGTFSNLFYDEGGTPFDILVLRFVGTGILFWLLVGARRRPWQSRRIVSAALALGVFQVGANYSLFEGFARAPASLVVLLFYIYPLLVTLGAALLYREALGLRQILALALGLSGIALTVGAPASVPTLGVVLGLAAGVGTAAYILGARGLMRGSLEPIEVVTLMFTGPAIGFAIAAGVHGVEIPSAPAAGYAAGLVVVGTLLAMIFFYGAVKLVGAGRPRCSRRSSRSSQSSSPMSSSTSRSSRPRSSAAG